MNSYALVINGVFQEVRQYPEKPVDIPHKNVKWLPLVTETVNEATTLDHETTSEYIVQPTRVLKRNTIRDLPLATRRSKMSCTPFQARMALKSAGLLGSVLSLIESLPETDDARIAWEYAISFERNSPFIATLGWSLNLTEEQIDSLFLAAQQV